MTYRLVFAAQTIGGAAAAPGMEWPSAAEKMRSMVPEVRQRAIAALAVFAPVLILPLVGTAGDIAILIWLYLAVLGLEVALALVGEAPAPPPTAEAAAPELAAACIATLALLAIAPLGIGALLTVMLYACSRAIGGVGARVPWALALLLGAVSTALLIDLALIALGLDERSSLWLALAAAVGMALATRHALFETDASARDDEANRTGRRPTTRSLLELAFACLLALVLALYGALLAHEPALRQLAAGGGYLTVPVLAAALLRFACTGLDHARRSGDHARRPKPDRLGILLLVLWALSATWLMEV